MKNQIKQLLQDAINTKQQVLSSCVDDINAVADKAITVIRQGGKIMFCGNGGSAADSQHLAAELVGRFQKERQAIKSIALTTDTSILTAIGNDYGYESVFARQVEALANEKDMLIGISSSGQSQNIVKAFAQARQQGVVTVALVGRDGGVMAKESDLTICVPGTVTARIQEAHICIGHILCELIENEY